MNLMMTMLLGGLWHGANWTFVVWGGLHGVYLSAHKLLMEWKGRGTNTVMGSALCLIGTFHLVALTWIFFRADSFSLAWEYLIGVLLWQDGKEWIGQFDIARVFLPVSVLLLVDLVLFTRDTDMFLIARRPVIRGAAYGVAIVLLLTLGNLTQNTPFIYFQF